MSNTTNEIVQDNDSGNQDGFSDLTDPRKWLDYLDGKLSPEDERRMEAEIAQSEFLRDALEGLRPSAGERDHGSGRSDDSSFDNTARLNAIVHQLNQHLHQHLAQKKERRKRKIGIRHNPTEIAVILIVALCVIGYFLYRSLHH